MQRKLPQQRKRDALEARPPAPASRRGRQPEVVHLQHQQQEAQAGMPGKGQDSVQLGQQLLGPAVAGGAAAGGNFLRPGVNQAYPAVLRHRPHHRDGQVGLLQIVPQLFAHRREGARLHLVHRLPDAHVRDVAGAGEPRLALGGVVGQVALDNPVQPFFGQCADAGLSAPTPLAHGLGAQARKAGGTLLRRQQGGDAWVGEAAGRLRGPGSRRRRTARQLRGVLGGLWLHGASSSAAESPGDAAPAGRPVLLLFYHNRPRLSSAGRAVYGPQVSFLQKSIDFFRKMWYDKEHDIPPRWDALPARAARRTTEEPVR